MGNNHTPGPWSFDKRGLIYNPRNNQMFELLKRCLDHIGGVDDLSHAVEAILLKANPEEK